MRGKLVSLVGIVGGKERIEKANKVAVANEADVAYSDLVVEPGWTWFPQSMTMIQVSELLPIGIVVGHNERGRERVTDGRCPITLNISGEALEGHRPRISQHDQPTTAHSRKRPR